MSTIRFSGTSEPVLLGDIVSTRVLLIRRKAQVVYVPGISEFRSSLEHHGLQWVGLRELSGARLAALVDPDTMELDRKVRLVSRGTTDEEPAVPDPFLEPGEAVDPSD